MHVTLHHRRWLEILIEFCQETKNSSLAWWLVCSSNDSRLKENTLIQYLLILFSLLISLSLYVCAYRWWHEWSEKSLLWCRHFANIIGNLIYFSCVNIINANSPMCVVNQLYNFRQQNWHMQWQKEFIKILVVRKQFTSTTKHS